MKMDLGNLLYTFQTIAPVTVGATGMGASAQEVTGTGIEKKDFESALFVFENMKPLGVPLAVTITCKVQESSDDSSYTDASSVTGTAYSIVHNVTNTYSRRTISVDLGSLKKYVRGYMSVHFSGGTADWTIVSAIGVLGGSKELPTDSDNT